MRMRRCEIKEGTRKNLLECLEYFKEYFASGEEFSLDPENFLSLLLARIRAAERIRTIIPSDIVIEVDYSLEIPKISRISPYRSGNQLHEIVRVEDVGIKHVKMALREFNYNPEPDYEEGCRAANLRELLFFGEKYPELQRVYDIAALGTEHREIWSSSELCLTGNYLGRWIAPIGEEPIYDYELVVVTD
jgi:hypothetical protein